MTESQKCDNFLGPKISTIWAMAKYKNINFEANLECDIPK